jgi:hypothetical protein
MPPPDYSPFAKKSDGKPRGTVQIGPFSMMPRRLFASGTAARIGTSATIVLLALCEQANRNNGNTFKASDKALASETGLSPRTICDARKRLEEHKLISCSQKEGQSHEYTLPVFEFEWVCLEDRPRSKKRPRAIHATRAGKP